MTTMGDRVLNISLPKIGEKALFTKDLEDALATGRVDFVVHSLNDLPTVLPAGMAIGAILEREDPRDALVLRTDADAAQRTLQTLPAGSVVGTSSLRRGAQLARKYPHLVVQDIRGNLNTRLAKLDAVGSKFTGIILAQAGLERMGWRARINQTLESDDIMYAVGQGALAVECRSADVRILGMLQRLCCLRTQCRILTERSFLKTLGGGCSAPVAVITELRQHDEVAEAPHELHITGAVWSLDGSVEVQSKLKCSLNLSGKRTRAAAAVEEAAAEDSTGSDELPAKRARLSETPERSRSSTGSTNSSDGEPKKPASPTVVDDTPVPSATDMSALLRIHGDLLRKCPYAATHHPNGANGTVADDSKCPLNVVVGQDVMGACPYLSAEQKVLTSETATASATTTSAVAAADVMGKCPFSAAERAKLVAAGDATAAAISAGAKEAAAEIDTTDNSGAGPKASGSGCPFLKSTVMSEAGVAGSEANGKIETLCADVPLFCGLFRHECYALDWFERCERLGQRLAEALIENGAAKVMEGAQQEIRKGI